MLSLCPCQDTHDMESVLLTFFLTEAVSNIVKFLGMQPCERSDKVPDNKNSHTLYLAGELWAEVSAQAAALGGRTEPIENQNRSS